MDRPTSGKLEGETVNRRLSGFERSGSLYPGGPIRDCARRMGQEGKTVDGNSVVFEDRNVEEEECTILSKTPVWKAR